MKLEHIYEIKAQIVLMSGLHIGAGKGAIEIGGMDSPVMKHPLTQEPYIPGSSLKGKLRSMLETVFDAENVADGRASTQGIFAVMFGTSNDKIQETIGPTRVILRDALMNENDQRRFQEGRLPMEEKNEVAIDRLSGAALPGALRNMERVPSGVRFDFTLSLRKYENDEDQYLDYIWKGMRLLELDGIGGSVSRGSGQIRFENMTLDGEENQIMRHLEIWENGAAA